MKSQFKGKTYNISRLSEIVGESRNYLHAIAHEPHRWRFLQQFGDDPISAVENLRNERIKLTNKLIEIEAELRDRREMRKFGKFLVERGIYNHIGSFASVMQTIALNTKNLISEKAYIRYKEVIKAWDEYLDIR